MKEVDENDEQRDLSTNQSASSHSIKPPTLPPSNLIHVDWLAKGQLRVP